MKWYLSNMQLPSPVQQISNFSDQHISLYLKREDLIHPEFGGNKWRKLKYNLEAFKAGNYKQLITFGGPFSNHIAATASACRHYNIPCVGVIRGSALDSQNPTLIKAKAHGMALIPVSREAYKLKMDAQEIQAIIAGYPNSYILPEGGTNALAVKGTQEITEELNNQIPDIDIILTPIGTGGTAAGIINGAKENQFVYVINSMKNIELENILSTLVKVDRMNWQIVHDYHFGGFAKSNAELIEFINAFTEDYSISLDPVYTSKMMYALRDMLETGQINSGQKIAAIHTGGIQGITAYNYMQLKYKDPLLIKTF
ncbi:MAG: 1-aminocyclopropane-1-carboxylate deaminase/D-cysteine desulfhydrase [Saprospiraceae bacterium]|nr:1-aminocyclopropane-1-carboxylate deaminase/D-cysteine desulfhydrase [Saprospiraceae bacterium]